MDDPRPLQTALRHGCACHPPGQSGSSRRRLLLGALAGTALAGCTSPPAMDLGLAAGRIDIHHHLSPPGWVAELKTRGQLDPLVAGWTPQKSLADMDAAGITGAMLSITTPGLYLANLDVAGGRRVARDCNEYAARLVSDHPGRFGFFATLPLQDVEGSLRGSPTRWTC